MTREQAALTGSRDKATSVGPDLQLVNRRARLFVDLIDVAGWRSGGEQFGPDAPNRACSSATSAALVPTRVQQ
jgi:hypothetical protein